MSTSNLDESIEEALLASATVGVAIVDRQLRYAKVNPALARFDHHRNIHEHIGKRVEDVLAGTRIQEPVMEMLVAALEGESRAATLLGDVYQVDVSCTPVRRDGAIDGALIVVHDVTEKASGVRLLRQKLQMIQLVQRIATHLVDEPVSKLTSTIGSVLELIADHFGLDRAYLFRFSSDMTRVTMTHEHCADGIEPVSHLFQQRPVRDVEPAIARLRARDRFVVDRVSDLHGAERAMFEKLLARSFAIFPLDFGGGVVGATGFAYIREQHEWQAHEVETLELAMEMIAAAWARQKIDHDLRDRLRFEELLATVSTRLMNAPSEALDAEVTKVLQLVGTRGQFDRMIVFQLDRARSYLALTHEWCREGIGSFRQAMSGLPTEKFGWPIDRIIQGETIIFNVDGMPDSAHAVRGVMGRAGVDTIGTTPLTMNGEVWGALSFHLVNRRALDPLLTRQLRLIGETIASVLVRQRVDADKRRAFAELEQLRASAERERDYLREELRPSYLIGDSEAMEEVLERVDAVAETRATVLLRGESGVGKELFARAIHERSSRKNGPLVKVNCAAVPRDLFESEFFGHVKGAFTGAHRDRVGRFELANGGTLFLDEVGEIPLEQQAKLLRVLQEGQLERVGEDRTRSVDVRVVAATNRDLDAMTRSGLFRQDLFYRLSVFPIHIPPLRDRDDDIVIIARHFLDRQRRSAGRPFLRLSADDERKLRAYDWPGNVRELEHVIERAVLLSRTAPLRLDRALVSAEPAVRKRTISDVVLRADDLRDLERDNIVSALAKANGRVSGDKGAAALLGVRPSTLRDRMRALGVRRPE
jgi:transcriptional regulator with GAF, ATPase, and Fis domain